MTADARRSRSPSGRLYRRLFVADRHVPESICRMARSWNERDGHGTTTLNENHCPSQETGMKALVVEESI
jgi:hypothetical protein